MAQKDNKKKKDDKKQIDDTMLEWYGLTEEDIEKIKSEKDEIGDIEHDILLKAFKIKEFFYYQWIEVSVDDIIPLIVKWKQIDEKIYDNVQVQG